MDSISISTLLDASIDAAFLFNINSELVALNKEALKRLRNRKPEYKNKPAEFFIGRKFGDFYPAEFIQTCNRFRKTAEKNSKPLRFQYQLEDKILDLIVYPVENKNNPEYHFAFYSRDITKELEAENKVKRSEERYLELINVLYEGYIAADIHGNVFFINEAIEKIGGYNKSDLIGKNIMNLFPGAELKKIEHNFNKLKNLEKVRFQTTYLTLKNELRTLLFSASPIINEKGEFDGAQSTITDITVLKDIKEKLEYRIEFEKRIIEISSGFINLQESEIDKGIVKALDTIGRFNNERRMILYSLNEKTGLYHKSHEWNLQEIHGTRPYPEEFNPALFPHFNSILQNLEVIHVPDISALPPEIKIESKVPEQSGIRSFIIVPMILKNKIIGFLGIGSTDKKEWSEDEISMIKMALSVIAIVIERKTINSELTDSIFQRLSEREREFVTYLSKGYRWPKDKRSICKKMDVLPGTLDKFMQRIKEKIRVNDLEMLLNRHSKSDL